MRFGSVEFGFNFSNLLRVAICQQLIVGWPQSLCLVGDDRNYKCDQQRKCDCRFRRRVVGLRKLVCGNIQCWALMVSSTNVLKQISGRVAFKGSGFSEFFAFIDHRKLPVCRVSGP